MSTPDLPGNSKREKVREEPQKAEKKVDRIVVGEVKRRKKPLGRKFTEAFFGGGDARTVWSYVTMDVIIPGAKDIFMDVIYTGFEKAVYGETRSATRRAYGRGMDGPYVNYNAASGGGRRQDPRQQMSRRARANHDFDEIILPSRAEAEAVLAKLFDLITQYDQATVADLYDMVGAQISFTDGKWGWFELPNAGITRLRTGGFLLDLPRPVPLD